jgi:glyoxylase-like metal-dependent hydrolase (beta-lactamase superfamily II)
MELRFLDHDLQWRIVHDDRQLVPGIDLLHLPGHTPGLLGAHIRRPGGDLLIDGDQAFVRENYEGGHSMGSSLLYDTRSWAESRRKLADIERRSDATVLFGHDLQQVKRLRDELGGSATAR